MRDLLGPFRPLLAYAAIFSFFINLLMLVPPLFMLQVFDRVLTSRSSETLAVLAAGAMVSLAVMALLDILRSRLLAISGVALDAILGPKVLDRLVPAVVRLNGADSMHALRDVNVLRTLLTGSAILAVFDAPWLPFFVALIFVFHPLLGAVAAFGAALLILLAHLSERLTRKDVENLQRGSRAASRYMDATLRNAEIVTGLGMLGSMIRRWRERNAEVQRLQMGTSYKSGILGGLTRFVRQAIQIAMLCAGGYLVIEQQVTGGVMMAATVILGRALAPVEMLIGAWRSLIEARSAYRRLNELLAGQGAAGVKRETALPTPMGRIEAERVVFAIKGSDKAIIKGVSFDLQPGESLGLVGPSASGKSTLARLAIGVWKPLAGAVRLDGADVSSWSREDLGRHVGYLPQDVELFSGTVAENIARMGEVDNAAVIEAAGRARAHDMILRLPQGYDTDIGEEGLRLSGGQRQRIGLARALYGSPKLVVLDEPNANLDAEGEMALLQAMAGLKQAGVTAILISHRPSILAGVDKMLVLMEGATEYFGTRAEVMTKVTREGGGAANLKAVDGGGTQS